MINFDNICNNCSSNNLNTTKYMQSIYYFYWKMFTTIIMLKTYNIGR